MDLDVILGGFSNKEYKNSTAMVVTYLLDNKLDPEYLTNVKEWEQALLEILEGRIKKGSVSSVLADPFVNTTLEVAYSTERSLEDELSRQTQVRDLSSITKRIG